MLSGISPNGNEGEQPAEGVGAESVSIVDLLLRQASGDLDHIPEPTTEELDAIDDLDDLEDIDALDNVEVELPAAPARNPALNLLAELDEPELVSFEGLDDEPAPEQIEDDDEAVDDLLEDVESLIEDYIDVDLDEDELEDEGYDLDDDDDGSYSDLYGDDDTIIPSFREGEFVEEDEPDTAYYDDLR